MASSWLCKELVREPELGLPFLGIGHPSIFSLSLIFFFESKQKDRVREGNGTPTPVLLPGKSHGQRSLVGCSPGGCKESGTTERLHFHFSLLCIGEGNGNPLQCSCLENPRAGGAWWAAVYGVAQSRTRLIRLSSSRRTEHLKDKSKTYLFSST